MGEPCSLQTEGAAVAVGGGVCLDFHLCPDRHHCRSLTGHSPAPQSSPQPPERMDGWMVRLQGCDDAHGCRTCRSLAKTPPAHYSCSRKLAFCLTSPAARRAKAPQMAPEPTEMDPQLQPEGGGRGVCHTRGPGPLSGLLFFLWHLARTVSHPHKPVARRKWGG